MKKYFVKILKLGLDKLGFRIQRKPKYSILNDNPLNAARNKITHACPIFFDIGMNHGQTIDKILKFYPNAQIHGFEPNKTCIDNLTKKYGEYENIIVNPIGLGLRKESMNFHEYSWDSLSSFLKRTYGKSQIIRSYETEIDTLDNYCQNNEIEFIDFLKTDTEGFELNVLKGGEKMISTHKVHFILIELFFNQNYHGQSQVGDILNFLFSHNYSLVKFYDFSRTELGIASRCDALFMST